MKTADAERKIILEALRILTIADDPDSILINLQDKELHNLALLFHFEDLDRECTKDLGKLTTITEDKL